MTKSAKLAVIIPTTKGTESYKTIDSALSQVGFSDISIIITGTSAQDDGFRGGTAAKYKNRVFVYTGDHRPLILPGEARNDGLEYLAKGKNDYDYIMFLDDDIVLPPEYTQTLVGYLEKNKSAAAMGRVSSRPVNFWTRIIDYSNFWWLQMEKSVRSRGFLGAGATVMQWDDVRELRFANDIAVNEDTLFFLKLTRKTKRPLSFCAETTAEHFHGRKNFFDFFAYQFQNGKKGARFQGNGLNFFMTIRKAWRTFVYAYRGNKEYLRKHRMLAYGVLASFAIFQLGIEYGALIRWLKSLGRGKSK